MTPICADCPAKSAIVTGPEMCFQETWPISIFASIFMLNTEISTVFATALPTLAAAP